MADSNYYDPANEYDDIWSLIDGKTGKNEKRVDEFFGSSGARKETTREGAGAVSSVYFGPASEEAVNVSAGNVQTFEEQLRNQSRTDSTANRARRVKAVILYDGVEVGLSEKCTSVNYTDNDRDKVDEVSLTFEDRDAKWMMYGWIPEKGHEVDVTLWFLDWKSPGDNQEYHCGNFTVDDLTYSGPPWSVTIKAVAIQAESEIQTVQRSKTWENVTLKQIVLEKMADYGMPEGNLYWYGDVPAIEKVEQDNKTDTAFLKDICEKQGMCLKLYKKGMVVFDKHVYEPRPAKAGFGIADIERGSLSWNDTLNGTYTGAVLSYTNPSKKKNIENNQLLQAQVGDCGDGARVLRINKRVENEAEAQRVAVAALNAANEKGCTVSFRTMADTTIFATDNFLLNGLGRMDGKYYCESVTHSVSRSGHTMTVKGYRIWGRL